MNRLRNVESSEEPNPQTIQLENLGELVTMSSQGVPKAPEPSRADQSKDWRIDGRMRREMTGVSHRVESDE